IEWPESAFVSPKAPVLVCVYGNYSFGIALSEFTRTQEAHGRRIDVRWARNESDVRECHVVFISRSERKNYSKILGALRGTMILTIGETQDFAESGGMIGFAFQNGALTFEVNLVPVEEAHLKISSGFLALAHRVMRGTESAKG